MKKVLPTEYPIVTGYPVIANALSILQTKEETTNWILLNLIVPIVMYEEKNDKLMIDLGGDHTPWNTRYLYDDCPYLTVYRYDRTWFCQQKQDILPFIKWNIDHEKYIYSDVCEKYIPEYNCDFSDKLHDLFIYGYDEEEKLLFGSDFFYGEKYRNISISFDDYRKAFDSVEEQGLPHRVEQTTDIMAITHRKLFNSWLAVDYEDPKCVLPILKERILECLGKTNVSYMRRYDENLVYGIKGYDLLQKYFQDKNFCELKYTYYNRMCIQFLVEHKMVLFKICNKILKNDCLSNQAKTLFNLASIIKGCVLKAMVKQNCSSVERQSIVNHLNNIKKQELTLLTDMLTFIDEQELYKPLI
ncbi:hypothetical protein [Fumia xinanensis]|uniref:Uncharacterized protein n=1 Tax=Fumia xinanensis TaxID=2763659 RepID=A0A926I6V5_9FIRM|nr:hypothetical protein [Fumia xinanensis]MBC8559261.1 hypothetical protein [Fumia xinanensis]